MDLLQSTAVLAVGGNFGLALVRTYWICVSDPGCKPLPPALLDKRQGRMVFLFKDPHLPVITGESAEYVTELSKPVSYALNGLWFLV